MKLCLDLVEGGNVNRLNKILKFCYFFLKEIGSNLNSYKNVDVNFKMGLKTTQVQEDQNKLKAPISNLYEY